MQVGARYACGAAALDPRGESKLQILKSPASLRGFSLQLAERTGLEPATSGVTGQHSNQLNYRSTLETWCVVGAEGFEPPTLSV